MQMLSGFDDWKKIGTMLMGIGGLFFLLGVMLFFDSGLIAIGDVLFLVGITLTIGVQTTVKFFARKERIRGTVCFLGGMLLVLWRWSIVGVFVQGFGFLNLFGAFFPMAVQFLRHTPFVGQVLALPGISVVVDMLAGVGRERGDRLPK
jgi:hypothetical protein